MEALVYLNGELVRLSQARISVTDYGFLYGYGLFETMRAYEGKVFLLERHLARLAAAADKLGFSVVTSDLNAAVAEVLGANGLKNARIRITISIGEGAITPDPQTCKSPTILIVASEYHPMPEQTYQKGYKVIISSIRRHSQSSIAGLKSTNFLESMLARQEARKAGADEALCLNEKGLVAEGSMSNIFIVANQTLQTPDASSGILPGITRGFVMELAAKTGLKVVEVEVTQEALFQAEEVFLTNSLLEVMPVTAIDGRQVGSGVPGAVTTRLAAAYRQSVADAHGTSS